jgi:dephospho-CoA kinase
MIRLAIVGDIGSGKSYVAKQFGYPVFNADAEVAKLYRKSRKCYSKLKKALPNYITSFLLKKVSFLRPLWKMNIISKKSLKLFIQRFNLK